MQGTGTIARMPVKSQAQQVLRLDFPLKKDDVLVSSSGLQIVVIRIPRRGTLIQVKGVLSGKRWWAKPAELAQLKRAEGGN